MTTAEILDRAGLLVGPLVGKIGQIAAADMQPEIKHVALHMVHEAVHDTLNLPAPDNEEDSTDPFYEAPKWGGDET